MFGSSVPRSLLAVVAAAGLLLSGCSDVPREEPPAGWSLDVHQPGEWWTAPLIPRSVVLQHCPLPKRWSSDPDLRTHGALPPGTSVEYSFFVDDYHCGIGWSQPESEPVVSAAAIREEVGIRRACSASGLPMDKSWSYVSHTERSIAHPDMPTETRVVAAFRDSFDAVVSCVVSEMGEVGPSLNVSLSSAAVAEHGAAGRCPAFERQASSRGDGDVLDTVELRGARPVRDQTGRVRTDAATLRLRLTGDSTEVAIPVRQGIAFADVDIRPTAQIPFTADGSEPLTGTIVDAAGKPLGTCATR